MELIVFKVVEPIEGFVRLMGQETIRMEEGDHLKIEANPHIGQILMAKVPSGKHWEVFLRVEVKEAPI